MFAFVSLLVESRSHELSNCESVQFSFRKIHHNNDNTTCQVFHTVRLITVLSYLDVNEVLRFFNSLNIGLVNGAFCGDTA